MIPSKYTGRSSTLSGRWLLHAVEPFLGAGERRALSFNAFVE